MKPINYSYGRMSREVEMDWEAVGSQEMNDLYKIEMDKIRTQEIIHKIDHVISLLEKIHEDISRL